MIDKERAELRLKCIQLVIEAGSRVQIIDPFERAEQYYEFISGVAKPAPKLKTTKKQVAKKQVVKEEVQPETAQPEKNPFGDSGRQQVML